MSEPTFEELWAEITAAEEAQADPGPEYLSREEWRRRWGVTTWKASQLQRRLLADGRMEQKERLRTRPDGRRYWQPVYRLILKE